MGQAQGHKGLSFKIRQLGEPAAVLVVLNRAPLTLILWQKGDHEDHYSMRENWQHQEMETHISAPHRVPAFLSL